MVFGAEEVFAGDKDVGEDELACVGAPHTELVELAGAGVAGDWGGKEKSRYPFWAEVWGCFGIDDDVVGVWALHVVKVMLVFLL